jgi:hypothetical protein
MAAELPLRLRTGPEFTLPACPNAGHIA